MRHNRVFSDKLQQGWPTSFRLGSTRKCFANSRSIGRLWSPVAYAENFHVGIFIQWHDMVVILFGVRSLWRHNL